VSAPQIILGPVLNPRPDGLVDFIAEGALACDDRGIITYAGPAASLPGSLASSRRQRRTTNLIVPPFLDAHVHVPQHPIRGHFMDGVANHPPEGRLIAGLNRNVFPAEARCAEPRYAEHVVDEFARDTLAHGVVGGSAYMTVHPAATRVALERLGPFWSGGLVLMEMNCPPYLRIDRGQVNDALAEELAARFGRRFVMTDRFAVAVGSDLRRWASRCARELGLRTQTHLNEQRREKALVEQTLYPSYASYTDVYWRDGLLDSRAILAHCVHMRPQEWEIVARTRSAVAHCPTSNALLGSGIMPLDEVLERGIDYAICTDMGASPTTSLLAEMAQFLKVHAGRSRRATPQEALYRATLAPARILGLDGQLGSFAVGKPLSLVEVACGDGETYTSADDAILSGLLGLSQRQLDFCADPASPYGRAKDQLAEGRIDGGPALDLLERDVRETVARLEDKVVRVTLAGQEA
jgi:guanine deaminase